MNDVFHLNFTTLKSMHQNSTIKGLDIGDQISKNEKLMKDLNLENNIIVHTQ
jgi:hypothetical protein